MMVKKKKRKREGKVKERKLMESYWNSPFSKIAAWNTFGFQKDLRDFVESQIFKPNH